MTKGNMTREQAIEAVGENAVDAVESKNCDFTNRVMPDNDDRVEFSAAVSAKDRAGQECTLIAYYYPTQAQLVDAGGDDLGNVPWEIEGFEIV